MFVFFLAHVLSYFDFFSFQFLSSLSLFIVLPFSFFEFLGCTGFLSLFLSERKKGREKKKFCLFVSLRARQTSYTSNSLSLSLVFFLSFSLSLSSLSCFLSLWCFS